jgi:ADP-ribosylglycohydrolase
MGGDCDTTAAMCGSIAEAYFGVPKEFEEKAISFLDPTLRELYSQIKQIGGNIIL